MGRERLALEFERYTTWAVEAIETLQPDDPIPPACLATANPALFKYLSDVSRAAESAPFLDVGCGPGGPGAWMAVRLGCQVIGVDVMEACVRAQARLFGTCGVVATSRMLPFASGSFEGAWALGVLETIDDKPTALAEVHRVLAPGARFGVYSYVAAAGAIEDQPRADRFESPNSMVEAMSATGFRIIECHRSPGWASAPPSWTSSIADVRAEIHRRHTGDPALTEIKRERDKIKNLRSTGAIEPWIFVLEKGTD